MLRVLISLIAIGAGGAAAVIATQQTGGTPEVAEVQRPQPATEMTAVLLATENVRRGGEVRADALRWQPWPANAVPTGFIERSAEPEAAKKLSGMFASRMISAGEPLTMDLLTDNPGGFLAAMLSPGMRAVGISASPESTAGGFILPNDRVDVLYTDNRLVNGDEIRSRTLLRGVRVLAIDQTTEDTENGTVLGKTATLELTELQAEVVTAAEATGSLALSLRPLADALSEPSLAIVEQKEAPKTIRINRGGTVEEVVIN